MSADGGPRGGGLYWRVSGRRYPDWKQTKSPCSYDRVRAEVSLRTVGIRGGNTRRVGGV